MKYLPKKYGLAKLSAVSPMKDFFHDSDAESGFNFTVILLYMYFQVLLAHLKIMSISLTS